MRNIILILSTVYFFLSFTAGQAFAQVERIKPSDPLIHYTGRTDKSNPDKIKFSYPGTSVKFRFKGIFCNILLENRTQPGFDTLGNYYYVMVDQAPPKKIMMTPSDHVYRLKKLDDKEHTVELIKLTESLVGDGIFLGIEIDKGRKLLPVSIPERKIEFIGNSITCGYGIEGGSPECHFSPVTENHYLAYAAITARNLNAESMTVAFSGKGVIQNYDKTGETIPEIYLQIFPDRKTPLWNFKTWVPDAVVINLGTNDFAHAAPDSAKFVSTYLLFLRTIRKNYPDAHIFCIEGSMIKDGWPVGVQSLTLIKKFLDQAILRFKSENDRKISSFYLSTAEAGDFGCDYHPNSIRHQKMADELSAFIKMELKW